MRKRLITKHNGLNKLDFDKLADEELKKLERDAEITDLGEITFSKKALEKLDAEN